MREHSEWSLAKGVRRGEDDDAKGDLFD